MNDTRHHLLESACHVFADTGFHDASIAEICERANANIAAVNYHFRSKKELYVEVLHHAFAVAEERRPLQLSAEDTPDPEERLTRFIDNQFHRIFCTGICGCAARLTAHEMTNPTFAHEDVFLGLAAPWFGTLEDIVAGLLDESASEEELRACVLSVVSLFGFYQLDKNARRALLGPEGNRPQSLDDVVRHTTAFALAGIAATRESLAIKS